jgi:hypothetical protein
MAIQRSELPKTDPQEPWERRRKLGETKRSTGNRNAHKSSPLGKLYTKVLESPIDVSVDDPKGSTLSFSVDDYKAHFGSHPEEHLATIADAHKRSQARKAKATGIEAPAEEPAKTPESAPTTRPAIFKEAAANAPASSGSLRCPNCKATTNESINTDAGRTFLSYHTSKKCQA